MPDAFSTISRIPVPPVDDTPAALGTRQGRAHMSYPIFSQGHSPIQSHSQLKVEYILYSGRPGSLESPVFGMRMGAW